MNELDRALIRREKASRRFGEFYLSRRGNPTQVAQITRDQIHGCQVLGLKKPDRFELEVWLVGRESEFDESIFQYCLGPTSMRQALGKLRSMMRRLSDNGNGGWVGLANLEGVNAEETFAREPRKLTICLATGYATNRRSRRKGDALNLAASFPIAPSYVWARSESGSSICVEFHYVLDTRLRDLGEDLIRFEAKAILERHFGKSFCKDWDPQTDWVFSVPASGWLPFSMGMCPGTRIADLSVTKADHLLVQLAREQW